MSASKDQQLAKDYGSADCGTAGWGAGATGDHKAARGVGSFWEAKLQLLHDLAAYRSAKSEVAEGSEEFHSLFRRFLTRTVGRRCLRLVFDTDRAPALDTNWTTVDLKAWEDRAHECGLVQIDAEEGVFDAVLCTGLERVSQPRQLISEIRRVLDGAGQVWIQVPLSAPYVPSTTGADPEFWRITPDGLRVLMRDFDEILCSVFMPGRNALRSYSFYYGLNDSEEESQSVEGSDSDVA